MFLKLPYFNVTNAHIVIIKSRVRGYAYENRVRYTTCIFKKNKKNAYMIHVVYRLA